MLRAQFEVINVNGNDAIKIPLPHSGIFYKLLLEDMVDDMLPIIEDDYYKMTIVKYLDEQVSNTVRQANKDKIKDLVFKPALVIYTKSLYYALNKNDIENESFIQDFEKRGDTYIKIFNSYDERLNYILSLDSPNKIIICPIGVLINFGEYIYICKNLTRLIIYYIHDRILLRRCLEMSEDSYQLAQQTLELCYLQRANYEHYKQAGNKIETNPLANDCRRRKELLKERKRQSDILMSILSSK